MATLRPNADLVGSNHPPIRRYCAIELDRALLDHLGCHFPHKTTRFNYCPKAVQIKRFIGKSSQKYRDGIIHFPGIVQHTFTGQK